MAAVQRESTDVFCCKAGLTVHSRPCLFASHRHPPPDSGHGHEVDKAKSPVDFNGFTVPKISRKQLRLAECRFYLNIPSFSVRVWRTRAFNPARMRAALFGAHDAVGSHVHNEVESGRRLKTNPLLVELTANPSFSW
ncbi:unnamed protein product [Protopolystoma xenopodis]|uniref:Uncharacterized protein n=1 Tax=Protopolystoma xenopodis TaxID=117903 RepID=A0A3S5A0Z0_9PLAT|nr:unnamed protein product [Protopolystoma xenopodis]